MFIREYKSAVHFLLTKIIRINISRWIFYEHFVKRRYLLSSSSLFRTQTSLFIISLSLFLSLWVEKRFLNTSWKTYLLETSFCAKHKRPVSPKSGQTIIKARSLFSSLFCKKEERVEILLREVKDVRRTKKRLTLNGEQISVIIFNGRQPTERKSLLFSVWKNKGAILTRIAVTTTRYLRTRLGSMSEET